MVEFMNFYFPCRATDKVGQFSECHYCLSVCILIVSVGPNVDYEVPGTRKNNPMRESLCPKDLVA